MTRVHSLNGKRDAHSGNSATKTAWAGIATIVSIAVGIHAFWLRIQFGSSEPEDYMAEVGSFLLFRAGLALVFGLIAIGGAWLCRRFTFVAVGIAVVAAGASMATLAVGEVQARDRLNNFGPELKAVEEFVPPKGAKLITTTKVAAIPLRLGRIQVQ